MARRRALRWVAGAGTAALVAGCGGADDSTALGTSSVPATSTGNALGGRYAILTSQLAMPAALCSTLYADAAVYPSSASIFAGVSLSTDLVFADNTAAQIAQQTPTFTGSAAAGYVATALIGIAR